MNVPEPFKIHTSRSWLGDKTRTHTQTSQKPTLSSISLYL